MEDFVLTGLIGLFYAVCRFLFKKKRQTSRVTDWDVSLRIKKSLRRR